VRSIVLVCALFALVLLLAWPGGGPHGGGPDGGDTWSPLALGLLGAGLALGLWALTANRPGNFNIRPDPKAGGRLVDHGPYRHVRHPMYLALLIAAIGCVVHDPSVWRIAAAIGLLAVLVAKSAIEERALLDLHPDYARYRARTARLIPFVW
jgi:protein-S-isoprenylcysteine O-methyltransferase Ste14